MAQERCIFPSSLQSGVSLPENKELLKIPLDQHHVDSKAMACVAALILPAMVENRKMDGTEGFELESDFLNWFERCHNKAVPGSKFIAELEGITKNWPADLQRRCVNLGLLRTVSWRVQPAPAIGTKPTVPDAHETHPQSKSENERNAETSSINHCTSYGRAVIQERADKSRTEMTVQACLEWVLRHTTALEKENAELKHGLNIAKMEYIKERRQCDEQEKLLGEMQKEQKRQNDMICNLNEQLSGLEKDKLELQCEFEAERLAWAKDIELLKIRIERESSYVLDEFRNKLCDKLSRYYKECLEASRRPSSNELAEYLKYVVNRVFRELISNGINLEGER